MSVVPTSISDILPKWPKPCPCSKPRSLGRKIKTAPISSLPRFFRFLAFRTLERKELSLMAVRAKPKMRIAKRLCYGFDLL